MSFIKAFGIGLLYFIASPLILLACIIAGIFGLFNFLVQFVIMVINFFKGNKLFPRFKEDEEAYALEMAQYDLKSGMGEAKAKVAQGNTYIQNNFYTNGATPADAVKIASSQFSQLTNQEPTQQIENIPDVVNEPQPISIIDEDVDDAQ